MNPAPLCIELTRGKSIESFHYVDVAVMNLEGKKVTGWGDYEKSVLPRSAIKPIQALPLIETGAAEAFQLSEIEIALACSSHNGEKLHVEAIENWLSKIDCSSNELACGQHDPMNFDLVKEELFKGKLPKVTANNCSGKHTGFLTVMQHLGISLENYLDPKHPLHTNYVTPILGEMCQIDLSKQEPGVDGCGVPVWAVPLSGLATGWAGMIERPSASPLFQAMTNQPFYIAGTGRACTEMILSTRGEAIVKTGAEGVFCAVVPDQKIGIALKARDGASRAAATALTWLLAEFGVTERKEPQLLTNHAGQEIGEIHVSV